MNKYNNYIVFSIYLMYNINSDDYENIIMYNIIYLIYYMANTFIKRKANNN